MFRVDNDNYPVYYRYVARFIVLHTQERRSAGGIRILRHMGMCFSNGLPFHKIPLNTGTIFYKNIPKHGSLFPKLFQKIFGCSLCEHPKILKNGPIF